MAARTSQRAELPGYHPMRLRLRHVLALLFVSSCRCAELTPGLVYPCGEAGECEPGFSCVGGWCVDSDGGFDDGGVDAGCVPTRTCTREECGVVASDDGCGNPLDCGGCDLPFSCGLLVPNRCGCTPFDAGSQVCPKADAGVGMCGEITVNNCGVFETFVCGPPTCATGFECTDNICCFPPSEAQLCQNAHFQCGRGVVIDSCGTRREIDCGGCTTPGFRCIPTEEGSMCVSPVCTPEENAEFCSSHGANCGTLSAVDNCGALRVNVSCGGSCDAGTCTSTQPNQCVCQGVLEGCRNPAQCCTGLTCGTANLCCVALGNSCTDDSDCCGTSWCSQGACCGGTGAACTTNQQCCSGICGNDGGCEYVDAGVSEWDGGEL